MEKRSLSTTSADVEAIKKIKEEEGDGAANFASRLVVAMDTYKSDPKVLEELDKHVHSGKKEQAYWFKQLRVAWEKNPPKTPLEATEFVLEVFESIYNSCVRVTDLEGFLYHYGLPHFTKIEGFPPDDSPISRVRPPDWIIDYLTDEEDRYEFDWDNQDPSTPPHEPCQSGKKWFYIKDTPHITNLLEFEYQNARAAQRHPSYKRSE